MFKVATKQEKEKTKLFINCEGHRNLANGEKIYMFLFDEEGDLIGSNSNAGNYNGMERFKTILFNISFSSFQDFCDKLISSAKEKFHISTSLLQVNGHEYTVLSSMSEGNDTGCSLRYIEEIADREIFLNAVKESRVGLVSASKELKADKEIVIEAVKKDSYAFEYASKKMRSDREVIFKAVKEHGDALEYASEVIKTDREVVLEAVTQYGSALEFASLELQSDREIVLAAVKQNGSALQFASEELKADREVVLEAVKRNSNALKYASDELKAELRNNFS